MKFRTITGEICVNLADREALLATVTARLAAEQGFALATINLDHLVQLQKDSSFATAYANHDLIVADGNPVVWMSRLAKRPVSLVPGSEMVVPLAKLAAFQNLPIALFGSSEDSLIAAAEGLRRDVPGIKIAAQIAPPMGFDPSSAEAEEHLRELAASGARLVFLALGAPKQERFASRGRELTPLLGFASIGAGLDFIGGSQVRAPKWVQRFAMEWAWRMMQNPKRLGPRYARSFAILPSLFRQALKLRRQS